MRPLVTMRRPSTLDPDVVQAERGDVRDAAQRKRISSALHAHGLAVVLEGNLFRVAVAAGIEQFGAGVEVDAFAAEALSPVRRRHRHRTRAGCGGCAGSE